MIASAEEFGNDSPYCLESCLHVGILQGTATVMKTNDIALLCVVQDSGGDGGSRESPVATDDGPHDAGEVELPLGFAKAKPADSVGSAEPGRGLAGDIGKERLRPGKLLENERGPLEREIRMGIGVVADLMACFRNFAGQGGIRLGIFSYLEECGGNGVAGEDFEEEGGSRRWAIVKG